MHGTSPLLVHTMSQTQISTQPGWPSWSHVNLRGKILPDTDTIVPAIIMAMDLTFDSCLGALFSQWTRGIAVLYVHE